MTWMDSLNLSLSRPLLPQTKLLLISSIPQFLNEGCLFPRATGSISSGQDPVRSVMWHILEGLTTIVALISEKAVLEEY